MCTETPDTSDKHIYNIQDRHKDVVEDNAQDFDYGVCRVLARPVGLCVMVVYLSQRFLPDH